MLSETGIVKMKCNDQWDSCTMPWEWVDFVADAAEHTVRVAGWLILLNLPQSGG